MKEYLLNCGSFNIIVVPARKQYFVLGNDTVSTLARDAFVAGEKVDYESLAPAWFRYAADESWTSFDGTPGRLGQEIDEDGLVDLFVLKRFNFGSLIAVRDDSRVQVFKHDRLEAA